MELFETIKGRHSARAFSERPVEREKIDKILEAGAYAPSAVNSQPWRFYVAESGGARGKIVAAMSEHNAWAVHAPVIIVLLADMNCAFRAEQKNYKIDIGLCLENMMLAAEALGLGSCPCAGFDGKKLSEDLGLHGYLEPEIILPVGYELGGKEAGELDEKYGNLERELHKKGGRKELKELIFRRE